MWFQPTPEQIEAFVLKHFPDAKRRKDQFLLIDSPFDDDDGKHFGINLSTGFCHYWRGDEWAGEPSPRTGKRNKSFVNFVRLYLGCTYRQAIKAVSDASSGGNIPSLHPRSRPDTIEQPETTALALPTGSQPLFGATGIAAGIVRNFLRGRGIDDTRVQKYSIHYFGTDVVWPYLEYCQQVYWQSRGVLSKVYMFPDAESSGVSKGQFLYNFDNVEPADEAYIVESIFCCHTLEYQTLATGGADMTTQQLQKLLLIGPRAGVILAPDNDLAGLSSIIRNGDLISQRGFKVYYSVPEKIPYVAADRAEHIKDWNELQEHLKLDRSEIWAMMTKGIVQYTMATRVRLMLAIAAMKKQKKARI